MIGENLIGYSVDAGVATILFNRPDKLNALTPSMLNLFLQTVRRAAADPDAKVILITGEGRGFCAGLDLSVIGTGASSEAVADSEPMSPQWGDDVGPDLSRFFSGGWNDLITSRKPTIAAINGPAFGWGFILALHCDIRFASSSAIMNATFARLGVPAEKGSGWLLTRLIGSARALDLLYSARRIDGVVGRGQRRVAGRDAPGARDGLRSPDRRKCSAPRIGGHEGASLVGHRRSLRQGIRRRRPRAGSVHANSRFP